MFEISVKRAFRANHALRSGGGAIEEPHEHRFECEARFCTDGLGPGGMALDFRRVDEAMEEAIGQLREQDLHELPALEGASPSAENLAAFVFRRLAAEADGVGARVTRVTVWEDPDHSAAFFE